jgi:hypothetical protein
LVNHVIWPSSRLLPNTKVIAQDIIHADALFGKDLGFIQGKATRDKPNPVITVYINFVNIFTDISPQHSLGCMHHFCGRNHVSVGNVLENPVHRRIWIKQLTEIGSWHHQCCLFVQAQGF